MKTREGNIRVIVHRPPKQILRGENSRKEKYRNQTESVEVKGDAT